MLFGFLSEGFAAQDRVQGSVDVGLDVHVLVFEELDDVHHEFIPDFLTFIQSLFPEGEIH